METIKSFIYLDEYKMYSISSQIFEGLTEYSIDYQQSTSREDQTQSGPFASGRMLGRILGSQSGIEEKRFLHDYAYTLFERHLRDQDRVCSISSDSIDDVRDDISGVGFVAIRGRVAFNDMKALKGLISGFNDVGEALAGVIHFDEIGKVRKALEKQEAVTKDRNQRARLRQRRKQLRDLSALAAELGLQQEPQLLKQLAFLLDYGFQDQFEVRMRTGSCSFSSNLKREYLREDEELLVRKYSRFPDKTFVLFGTIAQGASETASDTSEQTDLDNGESGGEGIEHMKEAVMQLVEALANVEQTFSGKLSSEIIVDPIALYCEL